MIVQVIHSYGILFFLNIENGTFQLNSWTNIYISKQCLAIISKRNKAVISSPCLTIVYSLTPSTIINLLLKQNYRDHINHLGQSVLFIKEV